MRVQFAIQIIMLTLWFILVMPIQGKAAETIIVDGSTGVMPLITVLAKVYEDRHPGVTVKIGKGMGPHERLQALVDGNIDIAMASHGFNMEKLKNQTIAVHRIAMKAVVFGVNFTVPIVNFLDFIRSPEGDEDIISNGAFPVQ